jgi:hypothetical protein
MNITVACINKLAGAHLNNVRITQRRSHFVVVALMLFANWYIPTKNVFSLTRSKKGTNELSHVYTVGS